MRNVFFINARLEFPPGLPPCAYAAVLRLYQLLPVLYAHLMRYCIYSSCPLAGELLFWRASF